MLRLTTPGAAKCCRPAGAAVIRGLSAAVDPTVRFGRHSTSYKRSTDVEPSFGGGAPDLMFFALFACLNRGENYRG
jgi:hypothetical protein